MEGSHYDCYCYCYCHSFEGVREEMEACRLLSLGVNEQNEIDLRD